MVDMINFSIGQSAKIDTTITPDLTINRVGKKGAEVLSTPSLLMLMEQCSIKASDPYLPKNHTTVGYAVDKLRHLAPSSVGASVQVVATLEEIDRNRLTFLIEAFEGTTSIGIATHKRAVIPKDS